MKTKCTLASLLFASVLSAQTITYANYSTALTQTMNVVIADNSSFNVALTTTTGNGVSWNAAGLLQQTGTPIVHFIFDSNPGGTPNGSQFPGSNYAQYDPALTAFIGYNYYNISADSMVKMGDWQPSTAHEIYQDPDKSLVFPFSYGQSFTDNYAKTNYSNSTTISSFQTGTRTVNFNGFGTLVLPQGSFNNVALITELRTNSLGPNENDYTWFDITNGKQLMYYSSNGSSVTAAYTNDMPNAIQEFGATYSSVVFPNPAVNSARITINSNEVLTQNELKLYDAYGKEVMQSKFEGNAVEITKGNLTSGMYFYTIISASGKTSKGKISFLN